MRISNSKANTWRRCPLKYKYKYVDKLESRRKSLPLTRGDWLHQMLMQHYDGQGWEAIHGKLTRNFYNLFEEEREDLGDLPAETRRILQSYLHRYRREDTGLVVVDSEVDEILTLPNGLEFNFIIDLIIEEDGLLWLWDHKTVGNFLPEDFKLMDSQLTRYFWAAHHMGYRPLGGVIFNELRTKPPIVPKLTAKTKQLERRMNIDTDLFTYYHEIRRHGFDPSDYSAILAHLAKQKDKFFRRTRLPKDRHMTKRMMDELVWTADEIANAERKNRFPRTQTKDCRWDCEFKSICQTELFGGDPTPIIKKQFKQRRRPE